MLDIEFIRENPQKVQTAAKNKQVEVDIDHLIELDDQRRELIDEVNQLRQQRNELSDVHGKPSQKQIDQVKDIKQKLEKLEDQLEEAKAEYRDLLMRVPNPAHESVPLGEDDSENEVIREVGQKPEFDFEPLDHETLGKNLDLIDLETAAQTSGSRFYYLKNEAVMLEFALTQWLLKKLSGKGFSPVTTPQLVKEEMMFATGFFPAERNEIYHVNPEDDDLYLIGTSEVTLAGLHMFEPLDQESLPKRYVGFSSCFRREAGSYGKDTRGIFRTHQFDKLEMYSFVHPDKSWEEHEKLLAIEEEIMQELQLPYRVANMCTGDLGAPAAKKYDIEVWLPSEQRYREITSCSNTTDFQARRGGIKYRDQNGYLQFVHTLNGTAMATNRPIIAILENNQTADGKVRVPEVLQPYLGFEVIGS